MSHVCVHARLCWPRLGLCGCSIIMTHMYCSWCAQHYAVSDYHPMIRKIMRMSFDGGSEPMRIAPAELK